MIAGLKNRPKFLCLWALFLWGCGSSTPQGISPERVDEIISEALQSERPMLRAESIRIVTSYLQDIPQDWLERALEDPHPLVKASALSILIKRDEERALDWVLEALKNAENENTGYNAVSLALSLGTHDMGMAIFQHIEENGAPSSLVNLLLQHDLIHEPGSRFLSDDFLLNLLINRSPYSFEALELMHERNNPDTNHIIQIALMGDSDDRDWALRMLSLHPSINTWPYLRWIRGGGSSEETELTLLGLYAMGHQEHLESLERLAFQPQRDLALEVVYALNNQSNPEASSLYSRMTNHPSASVRRATLMGSGQNNPTIHALLTRLNDPDPLLSNWAFSTLTSQISEGASLEICNRLELSHPEQTLRLLWHLYLNTERTDYYARCEDRLSQLMVSEETDIPELAASLYFTLVSLNPLELAEHNDFNGHLDSRGFPLNNEMLYAYLEATLRRDEMSSMPPYEHFINHENMAIRLLSAVGIKRNLDER
jgi:hypothetical protein